MYSFTFYKNSAHIFCAFLREKDRERGRKKEKEKERERWTQQNGVQRMEKREKRRGRGISAFRTRDSRVEIISRILQGRKHSSHKT